MLDAKVSGIVSVGGVSDELREVCRNLLDNADVYLSLDPENGTLVLEFSAGGEEIVFECSGIHGLTLVKDPNDANGFLVGETHVNEHVSATEIARVLSSKGWAWGDRALPERVYSVRTRGGLEMEILCTRFAWCRRPPRPR